MIRAFVFTIVHHAAIAAVTITNVAEVAGFAADSVSIPSFSIVNGGLTLAAGLLFKLNHTGAALTNATFTAAPNGTSSLQILPGGRYLGAGGQLSSISYGSTVLTYSGLTQSPTITFTGSTGAKTTNYVGIAPTSYGPSATPPVGPGTYCVSNTVAPDASYFGATNSTLFTIFPRALATVSFATTNAGLPINPAFCGLSYEKRYLTVNHNFWNPTNTALIKLYSLIGPAVLRIGGNSVDLTSWGGLSNTEAISTPLVDQLASFVKALPANWHVLYGINLSVNNSSNCGAEAAYVAHALGPSLLGFEIGNEPDAYYANGIRAGNYTYTNFLPQWQALAAGITNAVPGWAITNGGNGWTLTGPATSSLLSATNYTMAFGTNEAGVISLLTQHYYRGNGAYGATMAQLLAPDPNLAVVMSNCAASATASHIPLGFRDAECNSYYYDAGVAGVPGLDDGYGTALWALDFMFSQALNNVQGVNFHGGGAGPGSYTPIADNLTSVVRVNAEFYGIKLFSLAGRGGVLSPTSLLLNTNINFTAYGVRQASGMIGVLLNNKDTNNSVQVALYPGSTVIAESSLMLTGSSLGSTNGYTLGGAPINIDGSWSGGFQSMIPATNGQVTVTVPPITAVWLSPATNSTNTLRANDAAGTSSFTDSTNWTDGLPPHIYSTYFTSTNLLRSPTTGSSFIFGGDALTIGPTSPGNVSFLLAFNAPGGTCAIDNCTLAGGNIDAGVANTTNYLGGNLIKNWWVVAPSSFGAGGDATCAIVLTNLNLNGTSILSNGVVGNGSGTMVYAGNAVNFTGPIVTSSGTTLQAYSQTNLGGNPASFNAGQLVLDNGTFQPLASMALNNPNCGVTLSPGGGAFNVGLGLTLTISNPIIGPGGLTNLGGGLLVLSGTNTYTGNTTVSAGTLSIQQPVIATHSTVTVAGGAVLNLSFTGTNQVAGFVTNGVAAPAGIYNRTTAAPFITGAGSLLVPITDANQMLLTHTLNEEQSPIQALYLTLTWPMAPLGSRLLVQTNNLASGINLNPNDWMTVPNSTRTNQMSLPIDPEIPAVYYRLVFP